MRQWTFRPLGELAEFRNGLNYTKSNFGTGLKVIGVSDFQAYSVPRYPELEEIDPKGVAGAGDFLAENDIVFVRSNGNRELIGRSLFLKGVTEPLSHSGFTIRLRFISQDVYPRFYAYLFRTQLIRQTLSSHGGGTNINNLNQQILSHLEVPVPSFSEQIKIAAILSAYDDLIENNEQRIRILEEMAQNLYQEWFIKFRFPGHQKTKLVNSPLGKIPQGWNMVSLGSICGEVRRSVDPSELPVETPYIGLEHMPRRSIALSEWGNLEGVQSAKLSFKAGEILFGKIRPYFHKVGVALVDGVSSTDAIVIVPKQSQYFAITLACVSSDDFVAHATKTSQGTKMPRANWHVMTKYPVSLPTDVVLANFNSCVENVVAQIRNASLRNRILRQTRDLLLPRLISGELDISELDIKVLEN